MIRKIIAAGNLVLVSTLLLGCAATPSADVQSAAVEPAPAAAAEPSVPTEAAEASAPAVDAAAEVEAAPNEGPKVVQTTAQAEKYVSEEEVKRAYRECMRKMRRITGSRIPRNACQGSSGLHGNAWNQRQEASGQVSGGGLPSGE